MNPKIALRTRLGDDLILLGRRDIAFVWCKIVKTGQVQAIMSYHLLTNDPDWLSDTLFYLPVILQDTAKILASGSAFGGFSLNCARIDAWSPSRKTVEDLLSSIAPRHRLSHGISNETASAMLAELDAMNPKNLGDDLASALWQTGVACMKAQRG